MEKVCWSYIVLWIWKVESVWLEI